MKNVNRIIVHLFILASFLVLQSCSQVGAEQGKEKNIKQDALIIKAKLITNKFKLTKTDIACLNFKVIEKQDKNKSVIDVKEIHNSTCGGDPNTSPRLFSIVIDEVNNEIWSDAKSLLGQLEKL